MSELEQPPGGAEQVDPEIVARHKEQPRYDTGEETKPDEPYHYLCGNCGEITLAAGWLAFKYNDAGELIAAEDSCQDPVIRCPVCKRDHQDIDDAPGVWDGTLVELQAEHRGLLPTYGKFWLLYWHDHARFLEVLQLDLVVALEAVSRNDKTAYDYHGEGSFNREGRRPDSGRWSTPRELANDALAILREKSK